MNSDFPKDRSAIVLSLAKRTNGELLSALAEADPRADLVELRLDALDEPPAFEALRAATPRPLLATVRRREEGGTGEHGEPERVRLLLAALSAGFELVDVEGFSPAAADPALRVARKRTILSFHDPGGTPADLAARALSLAGEGPAAVKVVPTARRLGDGRAALELQRGWRGEIPLACFAMGQAGMPTRVISAQLGGALTYVAPNDSASTAPGQLSIERAIAHFGLDRPRRPVERLFGIVSPHPERSFSPLLHNAFFGRRGIPALYLPIPVSEWEAEAAVLLGGSGGFLGSALPLAGLSVTMPWKEPALAFASEAGEEARIAGAANTLLFRDGRARAANTDVTGLVHLFGLLGVRAGAVVTLLGSGGAARGALVALARRGARVTVAARSEAARELADAFDARFVVWNAGERPPASELLVNATPVGMDGESSPVPESALGPEMTVVDLAYRPGGTPLALAAFRLGARSVDGFALLVSQGAEQAQLFTGAATTPDDFLGGLSLPTPVPFPFGRHWRQP